MWLFYFKNLSGTHVKIFDKQIATVCFADLDQGSKMIILKSILTTFIASVIFRGRWGSSKNWQIYLT